MRTLRLLSYNLIIGLLFFTSQFSFANPAGHQITEGAATVHHEANKTTVHQTSEKAIIHWDSFNIQSHETTHFQQPQGGVALNRINPSGGFSQIDGRLTATGTLILINGAGIHFGPGAYVNVGSLIAASANISNENFLAGKYIFDQAFAKPGSIINKGHIKAADYGLVALIGPHVENHGLIEAKLGTVALGSGNKATLDFHGNDLIHFAVEDSLIDANHPQVQRGVENTGKIYADGGKILVHAATASQVLDKVINMKGVAQASHVEQRNGKIILHAGPYGRVKVAGRLDTSGRGAGSRGGKIKVVAKEVKVEGGNLDVSGHSGGGLILLGAESPKSQAPITAERVVVDTGAVLSASALTQGDGGQLIIRAKNETTVQGELFAQGGQQGGKGGSVETASGQFLNIDGIGVDLTAAQGKTGTWSLSSQDEIFIRDKALRETKEQEQSFTILDSYALEDNLATANVKVETTKSERDFGGSIVVEDKLSWHSPTTLTLSAYRDVSMPKAIISNDAGGSLILQADNTGTEKGTLRLRPPGTIPSPQLAMSGSRLAVIYSGKKGKYNFIRMEDTPALPDLNLGQGSRYESRTHEEYLKKFAVLPAQELAAASLPSVEDNEWVSVSHPDSLSVSLQEEKSQLGDSWLNLNPVKSLTDSELHDFELLSESDLRQVENGQESKSPLAESWVQLSPDQDPLSSSWDSLASLADLATSQQETAVSPTARPTSSEANRFLTQNLEPLSLSPSLDSLSLDSLSLNSLNELLALHPDNPTPPPALFAALPLPGALPVLAVLPTPPVLAEPAVLQQPQAQITKPQWTAAPWEPASSISPLADPEEKDPLWVIEGEEA